MDLERLKEELMKPGRKVAAVALTHAPTNGGMVSNAEAVGELLSSVSDPPLYLLDACQTVGQVPLNVKLIGCDFLAGTSRKWLRGPRGVGFLYCSSLAMDRMLEPSVVDLHGGRWTIKEGQHDYKVEGSARRFEYWEGSVANKIGFGRAVDACLEIGVENIQSRVRNLSELTRKLFEEEGLGKCLDVQDSDVPLSGICSFDCSPVGSAPYVVEELEKRGVSATASGRSSTLADATQRHLPEFMLRLSPHYFNTEDEVRKVIEILKEIKK